MADWDKRFIDLAHKTASYSKDRNKVVGAVIVNDDKRVLSSGYNGMAQGINDDVEERHQKPLKLSYFVHAETNAVCSAARTGVAIKGCTMYVTFHPCAACANVIIQTGIKRVVCYEPDWASSWADTAKLAKSLFDEAGVEVKYHKD